MRDRIDQLHEAADDFADGHGTLEDVGQRVREALDGARVDELCDTLSRYVPRPNDADWRG